MLWLLKSDVLVGGHFWSGSFRCVVGVVGVIGTFSLPNAMRHSPYGFLYNHLCFAANDPSTFRCVPATAGDCGDKLYSKSCPQPAGITASRESRKCSHSLLLFPELSSFSVCLNISNRCASYSPSANFANLFKNCWLVRSFFFKFCCQSFDYVVLIYYFHEFWECFQSLLYFSCLFLHFSVFHHVWTRGWHSGFSWHFLSLLCR